MISKKLQNVINEQINKEFYSEYLYLSMAAYLEDKGLSGLANFMIVQAEEERFHAMKFFDYVNERGGRVILEEIKKPKIEFNSALDVFQKSLDHEEFVTKSINELMDVAIEENDHAAKSFLNWYVDEQVEEEDTFGDLVNRLTLIGGEGNGLINLDKELSTRTFTPPTKE